MPLYEYRCQKCGKTFEVIQKFVDQPLTVHPECGGEVERLISAPAFQFKGTGWYVTDYAKSGSKSPAEPKNSGNGETKTDTKSGGETKKAEPASTSSNSTPSTPSSSSSGSDSGGSKNS